MSILSPLPPTPPPDPKEIFTSSLWQRWLLSLYQRLRTCLYKSSPTSVAAASGVPAIVATLPANGSGVFLVTCTLAAYGDALNYTAWAMVSKNNSTSRLLTVGNAALHTISLSGLSVLSTQSSGAAQVLHCTVVQVG